MSATILMERAAAIMAQKVHDSATEVMNLRYRPATGGTVNGAAGNAPVLIPAITAEEVGMIAAEANAYRRGMQDAMAILHHEHQQLVAPDQHVPGANGEAKEDRVEPIY